MFLQKSIFSSQSNGKKAANKNALPGTKIRPMHLPLETFAEILQFSGNKELSQRMVFVSRAFAALALPILRKRKRRSTWTRPFEFPINDNVAFDSRLRHQNIELEWAIIGNSTKPILSGSARVIPFTEYAQDRMQQRRGAVSHFDPFDPKFPFDEKVIAKWRKVPNENMEWNIVKAHNVGTIIGANRVEQNRYTFNFEVPVDDSKVSRIQLWLEYLVGSKDPYTYRSHYAMTGVYEFSSNSEEKSFWDTILDFFGWKKRREAQD